MSNERLTMDLDDAIIASHRAIPIPLAQKLEFDAQAAMFAAMTRTLHGAPVKDIVVLQRAAQLGREGLLSTK